MGSVPNYLCSCAFAPHCRSGGGDVAAACGQLAGTIAEGRAKDEIVPVGSTVVDTWSGRWLAAPAQTPAFFSSEKKEAGESGASAAAA